MTDDIAAKNKAAWEESFELRKKGWGDDVPERLEKNLVSLVEPECAAFLDENDLKNAAVAQFCCNDGRDLMGIVKYAEAARGVGFDISENILRQARRNAQKAGLPCEFVQTDIAAVPEKYYDVFDAAFVIVGALCWFDDLNAFFEKVARCLKKDGLLFVQEIHPFTFMEAVAGENGFDAAHPLEPKRSYFSKEPFVDNTSMPYFTNAEKQKNSFYSFGYTMADVVNALVSNGLQVTGMSESDVDLGGDFTAFSRKGFPLSFVVTGRRMSENNNDRLKNGYK